MALRACRVDSFEYRVGLLAIDAAFVFDRSQDLLELLSCRVGVHYPIAKVLGAFRNLRKPTKFLEPFEQLQSLMGRIDVWVVWWNLPTGRLNVLEVIPRMID